VGGQELAERGQRKKRGADDSMAVKKGRAHLFGRERRREIGPAWLVSGRKRKKNLAQRRHLTFLSRKEMKASRDSYVTSMREEEERKPSLRRSAEKKKKRRHSSSWKGADQYGPSFAGCA